MVSPRLDLSFIEEYTEQRCGIVSSQALKIPAYTKLTSTFYQKLGSSSAFTFTEASFSEEKEEAIVPHLEERVEKNVRAAQMHQSTQSSSKEESYWARPPSLSCPYEIRKINLVFNHCQTYLIGVAHAQGDRNSQEDRFFADLVSLEESSLQIPVIGVCDGHGGEHAASYVSSHFTEILLENTSSFEPSSLWKALKRTCEVLHEGISGSSGTTLTVALIFPDHVWVANVGDSRAIKVSKSSIEQLSEDMNLEVERYKRQILEKGGILTSTPGDLGYRVNNCLNMARSLGDHYLDGILRRHPKITRFSFSPGDKLVIASDGIFELATTQEVGSFVQRFFNADPATTSEGIVRKMLGVDRQDNMTVLTLQAS